LEGLISGFFVSTLDPVINFAEKVELAIQEQGCQTFLGTINQNGEEIPN
jgi:hypothetical protein